MIDIKEIIRQLTANAAAMRALVQTISDEQAQWKPNPDTWSMTEVWSHVYNEEKGDFRAHIHEILSDPPQPWGALQPPWTPVADYRKALEGFLTEREASISWLKLLDKPDWSATARAQFGPSEVLVLSAGDVLVSWVEHDILHMRQMVELLHAWNVKQASPYSVQYAGGW